jgi:dephospho-CoA kinase
MQKQAKIIALTGGIASGKSTATRYLGEKGLPVIDCDLLGHRAYEPDTQAYAQVIETFGDDVIGEDGKIDRRVLGGKVFGDPDALKRLTDIIWPEIRRLAEADISAIRSENRASVIIVEAAVLFEAGWENIADEIWVVVVDPKTALTRAMARDGTDQETIQKRIDSQLTNDVRRQRADVVIDNSGDEDALLKALDVEAARILGA